MTAWGLCETQGIDFPSIDTHGVWELSGLKVHNFLVAVLTIGVVDSRIHRLQLVLVKLTWSLHNCGIQPIICWVRLIDWVIADDVRIIGKELRDFVPVGHKLILNALFVHV